MLKRLCLMCLLALCGVACIHVVVNVYFPEAEAKGALATLEDELLRAPVPKHEGQTPPGTPEPPSPKPQSLFLRFFQPAVACAAGPVTEDQIISQIRSMPEVMDAYRRIAGRIPRVSALRDSGLVGEGSDGLLKARGEIADRKDQRTMEDENSDRRAVIRGLARASLAAQGQGVTEEAITQVLPDAAATFAALRRDRAQAGWWVESPAGSWTKK